MKLEGLAILFIIIILPISAILSEYSKAQVQTLKMQTEYDTRLNNATYDAIKVFQLNTYNSDTSTLANSKMRDIEASANSFYNSVAANFKMEGYNKDMLSGYVPALVYTMYDGYYIYSEYNNTLVSDANVVDFGDKTTGLKPYIYYSARFKRGNNIDVVITYSLDNYITVQGKNKNGNPINISGYVVDNIVKNSDNSITYRGQTIEKEGFLREFLGNTEYPYIKKNGVKYYKDETAGKWFSVIGDKRYYTVEDIATEDDSAYNYYNEALQFENDLQDNGILSLTIANMQDKGELFDEIGALKVIDYDEKIEQPNSNFNEIRERVIRYSIEKNLSIAIANYNTYAGSTSNDFRMPKLKEDEWKVLTNDICLVSFMQGLSIGGKIYNGYSIVPNNKNKEVIKEDSIFIVVDNQYYKPNDEILQNSSTNLDNAYGVSRLAFDRKSVIENAETVYYYPNKALGAYSSIVSGTNVDISYDNIYEYFEAFNSNAQIKKISDIYYTALGREKYGNK